MIFGFSSLKPHFSVTIKNSNVSLRPQKIIFTLKSIANEDKSVKIKEIFLMIYATYLRHFFSKLFFHNRILRFVTFSMLNQHTDTVDVVLVV